MLYDLAATAAELAAVQIALAILPIGAIEQHSQHLPIGTDWLSIQALARRVGELCTEWGDVYLLPALPYSLSQCHGPGLGNVWLRPETLAAVLRDVVLSLKREGIHRIAVLNGHGGNFVLDAEIRELNASHPELVVLNVTSRGFRRGGGSQDIHAGAGETSRMLALHPELVHGPPPDYIPAGLGPEFLDYAYMAQISPTGIWGSPSEASAQAGAKALEEAAQRLAQRIRHAFEEIERQRAQ